MDGLGRFDKVPYWRLRLILKPGRAWRATNFGLANGESGHSAGLGRVLNLGLSPNLGWLQRVMVQERLSLTNATSRMMFGDGANFLNAGG